jgi:hypothetical protein
MTTPTCVVLVEKWDTGRVVGLSCGYQGVTVRSEEETWLESGLHWTFSSDANRKATNLESRG